MAALVNAVLRIRIWVWILVLAGGAALWWLNPRVAFDQSIEGFFSEDHPALVDYQRATALFAEGPFIVAAYDDAQLWSSAGMDRIRALAHAIDNEVSGVRRIDALAEMPIPWKVDAAVEALATNPLVIGSLLAGLTTVRQEIRQLAPYPAQLAEFRQRVCGHPLFNNLMVDSSGTMTALVVHLDPRQSGHARTVRQMRAVADRFAREQGLERVAVVGSPVLVVDGFANLEKDNRMLTLVAMVLMSLTMLTALRNLWWALLPLVAGGTTWLVAEAVIGWLDLRLTLSSGPIVAQTIVLCMPAACHLAMRYRQTLLPSVTRFDAARQTLTFTLAPVFWCALTAASGYLATFLAASVLPVRQMGLIMFLTNLVAGVLTFLLSAAIMTGLRYASVTETPGLAPPQPTNGIGRFTSWVIYYPVWALLLFAVPCLLLAVGIWGLRLETDYMRVYRSEARVAQDSRFVEERMGGIGVIEVIVPAPREIHAAGLERLRAVGAAMMRQDPQFVLGVITLADVLGSSSPPKNPDSAEVILQTKLSLLTKSGSAQVLDTLWNAEAGKMRLLVRIRESATAEEKERSLARLAARAQAELAPEAYITGLSYLTTHITRAVVVTAAWSAVWSCLIILTMLTLALRSILLAILAFTPTLLALGLVLGIMGWLDLKIDMATALVAGIAVGLSVDDAFHCLLHWQHERRRAAAPEQALLVSYAGSGPGVILSSSAVTLGFLALMFGEFLPMATFGWLVAVATLGGSIGNLVFIPACIARFSRTRRRGDIAVKP